MRLWDEEVGPYLANLDDMSGRQRREVVLDALDYTLESLGPVLDSFCLPQTLAFVRSARSAFHEAMSRGPDEPVSDAFVNELYDLADKDGFVANALLMALAEYARTLPELDAEDAGDALGNGYRAVFDSQRLGAAVSLAAERGNAACAAAVEAHKHLIARRVGQDAPQ